MRMGSKSIIAILAIGALCMCIDPYTPRLNGYESLLVIEGLLTNENTSYTVKVSKTYQEQDSELAMIKDATVSISDNSGVNTTLYNLGNGLYKTDSIGFKGIIGRTYTLKIHTSEGDDYQSDPCLMQAVPDIDKVYFEKADQLINNGSETQNGIMIYLDSKEGDNGQYYRWDFKESWKFKVPNPKKYNYINDSVILPVVRIKEYCWKNRSSNEVLIHSFYSGQTARIQKEPIFFIPTDKSDRLLLQYSILVRQYSISKTEYDFWNNMKQVNEDGGDIFAKQPFTVVSNIRNVNDPKERVLGYFQVSAVSQVRKNIPFSDIAGLNLPYYHYPCERIEMAPADYPWPPLAPPLTMDDIYKMFISSGYTFVEPLGGGGSVKAQKLVFTMPECADCELTGTSEKPEFWTDLN
jgi:hypothetical protein